MDIKQKEIINILLITPNKTEKIEELTEMIKNNYNETIIDYLKHLTPLFLLQQLDLCFQNSLNKKYSELTKLLEFFFVICKYKEVCKEMIDMNFTNILIFMLHDADTPSLDETNKMLILLIICELVKYNIDIVKDITDLFTIVVDMIQNGELSVKNLSFLILKLILSSNNYRDIIISNETRFNIIIQCFKKDLYVLINSTTSSLHGLECLDIFLSFNKYDLEEFQYIFDRKIFFKLDLEEKKKINEIKRKYLKVNE